MAVLSGIGNVLLTILKWILKIVLGILRLVLEVAKIFLLLLNLVFRVFMAFVGAGTPWKGVWLMKFRFENYLKNRRLVKYFFAMKKLVTA